MPEFLAEIYAPRDAAHLVARRAADAADQARAPGRQVRLLGAVAVPEEETCFCLYQAPSVGAVRAAMTGAGLRPDRITPAVSIRPTLRAPATIGGHPMTRLPCSGHEISAKH